MGVEERKRITELCSKCPANSIHNSEKKMHRCTTCSLWKEIEHEQLELIAEQEALLTPEDRAKRQRKSEEHKRKYDNFY